MSQKGQREKDVLCIFLHIQKCAGSTIRVHIERSLKPGEYIFLYDGEYFDVREKQLKHFTIGKRREEMALYLSQLTNEQKRRVRVLYGHRVYYGIHRFFPGREARYLTFIRHPTVRTLSLYNYSLDHVERPTKYSAEGDSTYRREELRWTCQNIKPNGDVLPFSQWFSKNQWLSNFMTAFLIRQRFGNPGDLPETILKKFYFVGFTEREPDLLFAYHLFGVRHFYPDQNVSPRYAQERDLSKKARHILSQRTAKDQALYDTALRANAVFRARMHRFNLLIATVRISRFLSPL